MPTSRTEKLSRAFLPGNRSRKTSGPELLRVRLWTFRTGRGTVAPRRTPGAVDLMGSVRPLPSES